MRLLGIRGEQAEELEDKPKGTSTYILDLEGVKRPTRNKSDIDPHFMFRAMDVGKWDYCVSTDLVLQPEAYRSMLCEQSKSQIEDQHPAVTSCGLISRVQSLPLFSNKENLLLLLDPRYKWTYLLICPPTPQPAHPQFPAGARKVSLLGRCR